MTTKYQDYQLIACPFCNRKPTLEINESPPSLCKATYITCGCGVSLVEVDTNQRVSVERAVAKWNKRSNYRPDTLTDDFLAALADFRYSNSAYRDSLGCVTKPAFPDEEGSIAKRFINGVEVNNQVLGGYIMTGEISFYIHKEQEGL